MKLDIGCGPKKKPGFFGMDLFQYEGVDLVQDITQAPWNIESDSCTEIVAYQVIEHVPDLRSFFTELHRIAADGCCITLTTPHYSSHNSWADPTHIHHLSVAFSKPFTTGYLSAQIPGFSLTKAKITFGSVLWTWPGRLICALFGNRTYEKRFCWICPASSIVVELQVSK
jgi:hypothetical protein